MINIYNNLNESLSNIIGSSQRSTTVTAREMYDRVHTEEESEVDFCDDINDINNKVHQASNDENMSPLKKVYNLKSNKDPKSKPCLRKRFCFYVIFFTFIVALIAILPEKHRNMIWKNNLKNYDEELRLKTVWHYSRQRDNLNIPLVKGCLVTRRRLPQKYSMFLRNYLTQWGGEIEWYCDKEMKEMMDEYYKLGQIDKKEWEPKQYSYQGRDECPPTWPRLHLTYKKEAANQFEVSFLAPKLQTGDELCKYRVSAKNDNTRTAFRQYFDETLCNHPKNNSLDKVNWVPLGPRFEWVPVKPEESVPVIERKFSFNFQGATTSFSRREMAKELKDPKSIEKFPWIENGIVKIQNGWSKYVTKGKFNYNKPSVYRENILNSVFTLISAGQSPESYRIYEAIDAASIPVFVFDRSYDNAGCVNGMKPFLDSSAPFVWAKSWPEALQKMNNLLEDKQKLEDMQMELVKWRGEFWNGITKKIECETMSYFKKFRPENYQVFKIEMKKENEEYDNDVDILSRFCGERKMPYFPK